MFILNDFFPSIFPLNYNIITLSDYPDQEHSILSDCKMKFTLTNVLKIYNLSYKKQSAIFFENNIRCGKYIIMIRDNKYSW